MRALAQERRRIKVQHAGWQKFKHSIFSPFRSKTLYYSLRKRTLSYSTLLPTVSQSAHRERKPITRYWETFGETRCTTNFPRRQRRLQHGAPLSSNPHTPSQPPPNTKNTTTVIIYLRRQSLYTLPRQIIREIIECKQTVTLQTHAIPILGV